MSPLLKTLSASNCDNSAGASADECALVASLRRNDATAYEVLMATYGARMLATARRFLSCEQDCADALQEAFLSAFQGIDQFAGQSKLSTWLHRIVVNVCLMKLRSLSRRHEVSIESLLPAFDRSGHHVEPVGRWHLPPDARLQSEEMQDLVRSCIDLLPGDYRNVLIVRDIEELSTDEAAAALGISPAAVKTRLHRARQALRKLLEPSFLRKPRSA